MSVASLRSARLARAAGVRCAVFLMRVFRFGTSFLSGAD